ncbi:flippase [Bacillus sp. AFS076308]|uniref:flippase n=1 Tax=Bacillus sp. AFS076308 TaxID=2033512 RepID=UPI000BF73151|nr:flippase [Bacillus sp. AFS076308]PFN80597.1 flippase [Bacillus sp. AFS076308]
MQQSSVKKSFFYQMIYQILVLILPFVTSPYIARVLGAEGVGVYSYTYSIAYYFVLFALLGIANYGNRTIAKCRDDQSKLNSTFSNLVYVHIIISLASFSVYCIYAFFISTDSVYAVIQGVYILSALFDISWFYFGIEQFKLTVTINIIIKIANVILVFMLVNNSTDLWKYFLIMSIGTLVSQLALWMPLKMYVGFTRPNIREMKSHVKPLIVLFIPAIAVSLYKYMDKIMIGFLSNKAQLGYFENAEKVINIPMSIIASFGTVMLPKMSNLATSDNKKAVERYMSLSMQFVMCLAFALTFGLAGVGTVFAPVFWGKEFELSGIIIMGLASTIPFVSFCNVIRTQYLIPNCKDREYLLSVLMGSIVNLVLNALLIRRLGAIGAMIGTIVAEVTVCFIQSFMVRKELPLLAYIKSFIFFAGTGALMFGIVYKVGSSLGIHITTLFVQILCGAAFYLLLAVVYFIFTKNEIFLNIIMNVKKKVIIMKTSKQRLE